MKRSTVATVGPLTIALLVVAMLGGCAPAVYPTHSHSGSHATSTSQHTPTPTPRPLGTPAALGPLPANALFRITATATASDGAVADLVETVFAPAGATAADTTLLNMQCNYPGAPDLQGQPTWQEQYPSPLFVTTTIASTERHGSRPWSTADQIVFGFLGSSAYSGSFTGFQADCSPGLLVIPGTVHGVAPVQSSDPINGNTGWASGNGEYGFSGGGADPGQQDLGGTAVISDCAIEVSHAAKTESSVAQSWAEHGVAPGEDCSFSGPSPA
jgi:hypothetical protein